MSKMTTIDYAFHIHTSRCRHASLEPAEEYVKAALEFGCKSITFTDHAPFPKNPFSGRMRMEELDAYEQELLELQQKYAGKIAVTIGLEVEYLPEYYSYYKELYERFDLLLLGQHHTSFLAGHYTYEKMIPEEKRYLRLIESIPEAIKTGIFAVVAHPERSFHEDCFVLYFVQLRIAKVKTTFCLCEEQHLILDNGGIAVKNKIFHTQD